MRHFGKMAPLAKWVWGNLPNDQQLRYHAQLSHEHVWMNFGRTKVMLYIISGEMRATIFLPEEIGKIGEDGLRMNCPQSMVQAFKTKKPLRLTDIISMEGLPDLEILEISNERVSEPTWFRTR